jgi:tetratricopeptide (TPR) repeat protein/tRNA A-37 threonylcarbamoyl transferase component Bud32
MSAAAPATGLWREALAQLDTLLELPEDRRAGTLAELATTRPQLHALVASLLTASRHAESNAFLEPVNQPAPPLAAGAKLGPWRVVEQIGSGGMGEVWLARRDDGLYEGEVAIKTLHPWLARGALRERFLREAQLLGRISHPGIARLLDAGVSEAGSVYLVLEFVRGVAIDRHCDERRLDVRARLELFGAVAAAVAHAHANLIVHRDLKPSNILVTDAGEVKLLDFGVAALLDANTTNADLTRLTGRAFTPEFAAPEQLRGEPITTATDVYSLGVLLYLLLTGRRPHGDGAANAAALEHAVLNDEAELPSRRVRADAAVAAARSTTARVLARQLAGDLDNIVARALEKRPADRYPGVNELAADVERHLRHVPVQARAAGLAYRAAKFARRNRLAVSVAALALLAVLLGAGLALWQASVARVEAAKATAIRDFLVGVFERNSVAHPAGAGARKVTAEELLEQATRDIRSGLSGSPEVRRELLGVMARLYAARDLQAKAIELLDERLAAERSAHGPQSVEVARVLSDLSYSQVQIGNYQAAESSAKEALKIFAALGDEDSLEHGIAYGNLAQAAYRLDREIDSVRTHYAAALALIEKHHPRNKWRVEMLNGLARAELIAQRYPEAVVYAERARALIEAGAVESDGIVRGSALETLAHTLSWVSRSAESEKLMLEAIAEFDRAGGVDHSFAIEGRRELGMIYLWSGRRTEARKLLGEALLSMERVKGADDPELTAHVRTNYASVLYLRGELAEAEPHMRHAYRSVENTEGRLLPHTQINLGRLAMQRGRFDEARRFLADIEADNVRLFGKGSWMHGTALARLGELALAEGRHAEAREYFTRLWNDFEEAPDALANHRAAAGAGLAWLALADGDIAGARVRAAQLVADIERSKSRTDMPDEEAAARLVWGVASLQAGDVAAARMQFERAVERRAQMDAPQSLWLAEARLHLAQALLAQRDVAGARRLVELAVAAHRQQGQVGPQFSRLLAQVRAAVASK